MAFTSSRAAVFLLLIPVVFGAPGCFRRQTKPELPELSAREAEGLLPDRVKDRAGWAQDIVGALEAHELRPTAPNICAVAAVIEQESGFNENPRVAGLSKMVTARLESVASKAGPLSDSLLGELLDGRAIGTTKTFRERLGTLQTERDVDVLFREILAYHREKRPVLYTAANLAAGALEGRSFEEMNPVTTAGSMQVSVQFSEELADEKGEEPKEVRDRLYTRQGGVYFGTWRLLGFPMNTEDMLYRFADYNAGKYSSRNAALQSQVAELTGRKLALDGDFLAYDKKSKPTDTETNSLKAVRDFRDRFAPGLSNRQLEDDLREEKSIDFERTQTWTAIRSVYEQRKGKAPPYAQVPNVTLQSPKLSRERTTAWFAESVNRRYRQCMGRAPNEAMIPVAGFARSSPLIAVRAP